MAPLKDITHERFGRLTVLVRAPNNHAGKTQWLCQCDCGQELVVLGASLSNGTTSSCGCYRRDRAAGLNRSHGRRNTLEYRSWRAMKDRCLDKSHIAYPRYGGRGITIHPTWLASFEAFFADMGPRQVGTTLDRIDNDGNYEPGNCRWAPSKTQAGNRRMPKASGKWKLTPETVRMIRELHEAGQSYKDLAEQFYVSPLTARRVVTRVSWAHIP